MAAAYAHQRWVEGVAVHDRKIIPFRSSAPTQAELEAYRRMTRSWSPQLRQLLFPEHFKAEQQLTPRTK